MDPVASDRAQNTTPTSADAPARRSQRQLRVRGIRYKMLAKAVIPKATKAMVDTAGWM